MGQERTLAARHALQRSSVRNSLHQLVAALVTAEKVLSAVLIASLLWVTPDSVFAQSVAATNTDDDAGRLKSASYGEAITYSSAATAS